MKILCTFSGRFGDILFSLPTVRQISKNYGVKCDFGVMPSYKTLLPLLKRQSYISNAFAIDNWFCTGSPCGDQPWEAPLDMLPTYDKVFQLTYRYHPHGNNPLIDFIAGQQSLVLDQPVVPFIETLNFPPYKDTYIAFAFNNQYKEQKDRFMECLSSQLGRTGLNSSTEIKFFDVSKSEWSWARYGIKHALAFVGCRSANWVLAHGVGQPNIFVFDQDPSRHPQGQFGSTFTNPHWPEITGPLVSSPEAEAERAAYHIKKWLYEKENYYASTETTSRRLSRQTKYYRTEDKSLQR